MEPIYQDLVLCWMGYISTQTTTVEQNPCDGLLHTQGDLIYVACTYKCLTDILLNKVRRIA